MIFRLVRLRVPVTQLLVLAGKTLLFLKSYQSWNTNSILPEKRKKTSYSQASSISLACHLTLPSCTTLNPLPPSPTSPPTPPLPTADPVVYCTAVPEHVTAVKSTSPVTQTITSANRPTFERLKLEIEQFCEKIISRRYEEQREYYIHHPDTSETANLLTKLNAKEIFRVMGPPNSNQGRYFVKAVEKLRRYGGYAYAELKIDDELLGDLFEKDAVART